MPSSDRAFRALAQAEPRVIVELLKTLAGHVVGSGAEVSPEAVADPRMLLQPPLDADWVARVGAEDMLHLECQGYRVASFLDRLFRYHLGFVLRYWPRRVRTMAIWLIVPPPSQRRDTIVVGDVTVRVTSVVVPEIPAELLLSNARTACFAPAADPGDMSPDDLCRRALAVLRAAGATWLERHMAVVAAAMQGRYESITKALEEADMEPIIIEDLVYFGEDRGRLAMARENVLEVIEVRGLAIDEATRARILAEPSEDRLREWLRRALTESSVDAVLRG